MVVVIVVVSTSDLLSILNDAGGNRRGCEIRHSQGRFLSDLADGLGVAKMFLFVFGVGYGTWIVGLESGTVSAPAAAIHREFYGLIRIGFIWYQGLVYLAGIVFVASTTCRLG